MSTVTQRASSITIFLADGVPDGLRTVVKAGSIGHFIACPRTRFPEARTSAEFARTGVYILCGPSEDSDLPTIYVGEGDPTRPRLEQHYRQKDFWTSLILFTANNQLNKAHVQYLESRLVSLARAAKRCALDNGNDPQLPTLAIADTATMEMFLEEMLLIFPLLGLTVFEVPSQSPKSVTGKAASDAKPGPPDTTLYLKARGIKASGYDRSEGFVVLAGSEAVGDKKRLKNIPPSALDVRNGLVKQGVLVPDADHFKFTQDYSLNSPSQAAAVVMGCSASGLKKWKDDQGCPLKDIRRALPSDVPRLPLPQARILEALFPVLGAKPSSMSRAELCNKVGFTPTAGTFTRALNGIRAGSGSGKPHKGLLDNGLVVEVKRDQDNEMAYQITAEGIRIIEDYLKKYGPLPPPRDKAKCVNDRYQQQGTPQPGQGGMNVEQVIRFHNKGEPYYEFTNFVLFPIELDGKRWPTSEHYYQAQKHAGTPLEEEIRRASGPREAFKLGRSRPPRPDWSKVRDAVMSRAVRAKFTQHAGLRAILIATGNAELVDHTDKESYWGDGGDGSGKNMYGRILMQVREELRDSHAEQSAANERGGAGDPHNLSRFVQAQEGDYEQALAEIRSGRKCSHWMWYIFPQLYGLGFSEMSRWYAIKSLAEAEAYLSHPVLGPRLVECAEAALGVERRSAFDIFGPTDAKKLRRCATLFACVSPAGSVFHRLLDKYFQGERDRKTLRLLGIAPEPK